MNKWYTQPHHHQHVILCATRKMSTKPKPKKSYLQLFRYRRKQRADYFLICTQQPAQIIWITQPHNWSCVTYRRTAFQIQQVHFKRGCHTRRANFPRQPTNINAVKWDKKAWSCAAVPASNYLCQELQRLGNVSRRFAILVNDNAVLLLCVFGRHNRRTSALVVARMR